MQYLLIVLVLGTTAASQAVETSIDGSHGDEDFKVKVIKELLTLKSKVAMLETENDKLKSRIKQRPSSNRYLENWGYI